MDSSEIIKSLKNQMLTLSIFRNDNNGILTMLFGLILMNTFEKITSNFPTLIDFLKKIILNYFNNKKKLLKFSPK